jgi:hypothetical protein
MGVEHCCHGARLREQRDRNADCLNVNLRVEAQARVLGVRGVRRLRCPEGGKVFRYKMHYADGLPAGAPG